MRIGIIEIKCPECQALLRVDNVNMSRQTRCPNCSAVFVPADTTSAEEVAPSLASPGPAPRTPPRTEESAQAHATTNPYAPTYSETLQHGSGDWAPRQIGHDEVFTTTWAIFKDQWGMACAAIVIVGAINIGINLAEQACAQVVLELTKDQGAVVGTSVLLGIGRWIVQIWLGIGQTMVMFDIARGREVKLGKLFGGAPFLLTSILAMILYSLMTGAVAMVLVGIPALLFGLVAQDPAAALGGAVLGMLIAIVPVIILALMFSQIQMLIVDRGLSATDSLRTSYEITNGNKLTLFVLGLMMGAIGLAAVLVGLLALCVGIIPAMIGVGGFGSLLLIVAYLMMTGQRVTAQRSYVSESPV